MPFPPRPTENADPWFSTRETYDAAIEAAITREHDSDGVHNLDAIADGSTKVLMTATERAKLTGIETGATANDTDANLKARANHTGTQSADTITDGTTNKAFLATERTKLAGIETGADVTDATNVDAAGAVMNADTSTASMSFVVDEDDMSSDSATKVPTQQSVKAYVDANAGGGGVPHMGLVMFWRTGSEGWHNNGATIGNYTTTNFSADADRLVFVPLLIPFDVSVDRIAVNVVTQAAAGGKARLGIFTPDGPMFPAELTLLLDAGEVNTDTTGLKEATINQALPAGLYWLSANFSLSCTITGLHHNNSSGVTGFNAGHESHPAVIKSRVTKTGSYAAFAASYTAFSVAHNTPMPLISVRRSA